ncbi:hypothetical protein SAE02_68170 [Skermanella aerolata]|uniref:Yip1 domain-containing protein n=1 Tax=Skermanella aerolata TaxID=393310 RepID=A0A512E1S0_9PROT|nr:hypothetical protein [Skermanella aerolata]GEO42669.1 hypothetical protein SAE02_68170 [Skermanella aerolata]
MNQGPQALPSSPALLGLSLAAYGLSEFILVLLEQTMETAVAAAIVTILLLVAFTAGALMIGGYGWRVPQTLTALAAAGSVVTLTGFGLRLLLVTVLPPPFPITELAQFLLFPLVLWHMLIYANLYRHALSGRPYHAFGLAVAYLLLLAAALRETYVVLA